MKIESTFYKKKVPFLLKSSKVDYYHLRYFLNLIKHIFKKHFFLILHIVNSIKPSKTQTEFKYLLISLGPIFFYYSRFTGSVLLILVSALLFFYFTIAFMKQEDQNTMKSNIQKIKSYWTKKTTAKGDILADRQHHYTIF